MIEERPIWERQPGEPLKQFGWFEAYRLAGPSRTVLGVYRQQDPARLGKAQSPSGTWNQAFHVWRWQERAEAFDLFVMDQRKAEREQEYIKELEEHRERSKNIAIAHIELAQTLLEKMTERIKGIEWSEIDVKQIPAFIRAMIDLSERALNAEGHALGLEELLGTMSNEQSNGQSGKVE